MQLSEGIPNMRMPGLFLLRLMTGTIFIMHGSMKWAMWGNAPAGMSESKLIIMKILSIAEPLGGLGLIVGFLTVFAAAGLSIIMIGALYTKIIEMNVSFTSMHGEGWEFDALIFSAVVCLMGTGPGGLSLDAVFFRKRPY